MELFNIDINVNIKQDGDNYIINNYRSDTIHEIKMVFVVDAASAVILDATAMFIRYPDDLCLKTCDNMKKLVGIKIGKGMRKVIAETVGGSRGCTHLYEMAMDSAKCFVLGDFGKEYYEADTMEQFLDSMTRQLRNTCLFHSRPMEDL